MPHEALNDMTGACGKVPARGDFVSQGLPVPFLESWNEWLQAVIAVSREQLGQDWLDCYLTSPVWHFALSRQVCGDSAVVGTLIPSVDHVGRHYPFSIARCVEMVPVQAWAERDWCGEAEELILRVLDDNVNFEDWLMQLSEAELPLADSAAFISGHGGGQTRRSEEHPPWVVFPESDLTPLMLLHHSYCERFDRYCLWWTSGSERVPPCLLVSSGLPQISQFAAMLDGQWETWGWSLNQIRTSAGS